MTVLLDTHTLLWFWRDDPKLSRTARVLIADPAQTVLVSVATCWEVAIKAGAGKMHLGESSRDLFARELPRNRFDLLAITLDHATAVERLPTHHKDPFDRLLIAQAMVEGVPIIGADVAFDAYPVRRIW